MYYSAEIQSSPFDELPDITDHPVANFKSSMNVTCKYPHASSSALSVKFCAEPIGVKVT